MIGRQGAELLGMLLQERTGPIQWVALALAAALGALLTLLIPVLLHRAGTFLSRWVGRSFREGTLRQAAMRTRPVLPHATGPLQRLTDPVPLEQVFVVPPLNLRQPSSADAPSAIRWWIVGEPGSGKTTLLQMLALRWSEAAQGRPQGLLALLRALAPADRLPHTSAFTAQIPFYLPASHYQPHVPLSQQLARLLYRTSQGALSLPADQMERWLQQGRCALLVDDLGQTDRTDAEAALLEALEALATGTTCSIVIAGSDPALRLEGFDCFDIAPWSNSQIQTLIERWGAVLGRRKGSITTLPDPQALRSALGEEPERWELARQPGFFSGLLALAVQSGGLPSRRSALYAQLIPILLDRPRALPPEEDPPAFLKRTALEHLAWAMRWLRRSSLPVGFIEEGLSDLLRADPRFEPAQVRPVLSWLRERCGLIASGPTIAFRHPAFASALIAQSALADPQRQVQLLQQLEEPEWQEALVMFASLGDPSTAQRILVQLLEPEDDFFHTRTRLAGRCLIEAPHLQAEIRETVVGRLRMLLTEAPYTFLQQEAASILARIPSQLEWLADQLRRPDLPFSARATVVEALAREQGPRSIGLLALALRDDRIPLPIRERIAEHLGHLGDPTIARDLLDLIGDESLGVELRHKVVMTIARIGDRSLGPALVEHLGLPWLNPTVREALLDALRTLGDGRVVEELVPLIQDPNMPVELRRRIVETAAALAEKPHLETLLALVENPTLEVSLRVAIVNALAEAGFRELGPWLMALLRESPWRRLQARVKAWTYPGGPFYRLERLARRLGLAGVEEEEFTRLLLQRQAIIALGLLKEARAIPLLLRILRNPQAHPSLRALVPDALATIGAQRAVPQLLEVLRDRRADSAIRERIALALGAMRASAAIPSLLELLRDPTEDPFLQARAALAIGLIREPSVALELIPLLRQESLPVTARRAIADALGTLGAREVVRSLIQLLPDERIPSSVRQAIAETIGVLGSGEIGEELMWLARDVRIDPHVRGAIALTLATLRHRPATQEILPMLQDTRIDPAIRQALAESLENLWDPALIAPLTRLLLESTLEPVVRQGILRILERQGGPEAFPTLWILTRNPEAPMALRRAAADALVTCAGPEFEDALLVLALDPEIPPYIQGRALEALRRVGNDPDTVQALIKALSASEMPNAVFLTLMEVARRARVRLLLRETLSHSAPEEGHLRPPEGEGRSAG